MATMTLCQVVAVQKKLCIFAAIKVASHETNITGHVNNVQYEVFKAFIVSLDYFKKIVV
jgi:hypothetical protein